MKNEHSQKKQITHLADRWLEALKADVAVNDTTDDQLMLWTASDALEQATHDLRLAIKEANRVNLTPASQRIGVRLKLIAIGALKKYVAFLRIFPPSLLVLPLFAANLCLLGLGTPWLLFGLHINFWFVIPFVIANLVAFRFIVNVPDQQVSFILKKAQEIAESAKHDLLLPRYSPPEWTD